MSIDGIPEEALDVEGCPIFFHFVIDALCLIFIADIPPPGFLDCDSCGSSFDDVVDIEDEGFFKVLQHRHHLASLLFDFEANCPGVMIIDHSGQLFHDKLILALEIK